MDCKRMADLLPDHLQGTLGAPETELVEAHLKTCAACSELVTLGAKLAELPQEQASPALRARFETMLEAYEEGQRQTSRESRAPIGGVGAWLRPGFAFGALAVLLVVAGFAGGRYFGGGQANRSDQELTAMQAELTNMRQLVVLSMLQEESASQRLQGVNWSTRQQQADPKILAALLHTLHYDSSVDVRLAALDALSRYGDQTQVRQGLTETLETQQSPLVQVQLIDLLVQWRDRKAIDQLHKLEQDQTIDPVVRDRAHHAIDQLS